MRNTVIKRTMVPDDLCMAFFNYRLRALSCGFVNAYDNETDEENFTHLYRLCYFLQGNATCYVNHKTYKINRKTVLYLPPNHNVDIIATPNSEPTTLFFINFEIGNLAKRNEFHEMMMEHFPQLMIPDEHGLMMNLFDKLFNEASDQKIGFCNFSQNLFHMILISMIRSSGNINKNTPKLVAPKVNCTTILINQASDYISNHLKENIKINQMAKELGISENYLYKLFKEHVGKSPQQFLLDYRMQVAKEFLGNMQYSVKMIAHELGYCSANHFSTAFKKNVGLSPNIYRIQLFKTPKDAE